MAGTLPRHCGEGRLKEPSPKAMSFKATPDVTTSLATSPPLSGGRARRQAKRRVGQHVKLAA
jgi:hypothetical protein